MDLKEVMDCKSFAVVGDTLCEDKYACKIKNGLMEKGYKVFPVGKELSSINDIGGDIDIIDLCINPESGLALIKECKKPFKCIVIQPGAQDKNLISYLRKNRLPYIEDCLMVGLRKYPKEEN